MSHKDANLLSQHHQQHISMQVLVSLKEGRNARCRAHIRLSSAVGKSQIRQIFELREG